MSPKAEISLRCALGLTPTDSSPNTVFTSSEGASLIEKQLGFTTYIAPFMRRYNYLDGAYVEVPVGPGYLDAEFEEALIIPDNGKDVKKGYRIIWRRDKA